MEPLTIIDLLDRAPENEIFEAITDWILELSLGRVEYEEDGEHLVEEASSRWPAKSIRKTVALALTAAEMRMDMAISQNYKEPISNTTKHRRKIELIDNLVVRELEQLQNSITESVNSKLGVKDKVVYAHAGTALADELEPDLVDMIQTSYAKAGGNPKINKVGDISAEYPDWVLMDIDEDPEVDVALFGRPTKFGPKLGASATDGTQVAKDAMTKLKGDLLRNGWWAEVSGAPAHIALNKLKMMPIEDKEAVIDLLDGKKIEWHGEHPEGKFPGTFGWYSRDIGGTKHAKIIVGNF